MNTVMTVMGDLTEDDIHIINTHFSLFTHSTQSTHHTIAIHTIIIHTIINHTTVLMALNISNANSQNQGPAEF